MAEDQVLMKHESSGPDTEPARVSRRAFERSWSKKGWKLIEENTVTLPEEPVGPTDGEGVEVPPDEGEAPAPKKRSARKK